MPQYFEAECPGCRLGLRIRSEYRGRLISCNHCHQAFIVRSDDGPLPEVLAVPGATTGPTNTVSDGDAPPREARQDAEVQGLRAELAACNVVLEELGRRLDAAARERDLLRAESDRLQGLYTEALEASHRDSAEAEGLRELCDRLTEEMRVLRQRCDSHADDAERLLRLERELHEAGLAKDRADRERQEQARESAVLRAELSRERGLYEEQETHWRESRERDSRAALAQAEAERRSFEEWLRRERQGLAKRYRRRLREARAEWRERQGCLEAAAERHREELGALRAECDRLEVDVCTERQARAAMLERIEGVTRECDRVTTLLEETRCRSAARRSVLTARLGQARTAGRRARAEAAELADSLERARQEASRREEALGGRIRALEDELEVMQREREAERLVQRQQLAEAQGQRDHESSGRGRPAEDWGQIEPGAWGPFEVARDAEETPRRSPLALEAPGASRDHGVMVRGVGEVPAREARPPLAGSRVRGAGGPAPSLSRRARAASPGLEGAKPDSRRIAVPWGQRPHQPGPARCTLERASDPGASAVQPTWAGGEEAAARERIGMSLHESIAERSLGIVRVGHLGIPRLGAWLRRALSGWR